MINGNTLVVQHAMNVHMHMKTNLGIFSPAMPFEMMALYLVAAINSRTQRENWDEKVEMAARSLQTTPFLQE